MNIGRASVCRAEGNAQQQLNPRPKRNPQQNSKGPVRGPQRRNSAPTQSSPNCPPQSPSPREQVSFPSPLPPRPHVAIIGGGLSGLVCALELAKHKIPSTVFDTGEHGVGGRLGTRSAIDGSLRNPEPFDKKESNLIFDHAAQFFTASDPRFKEMVEKWEDEGAVQPWFGDNAVGTIELSKNRDVAPSFTPLEESEENPRYIGVLGMRRLAQYLAKSAEATGLVEIRTGMWINWIRADASRNGWKVKVQGGVDQGFYNAVVIAHNGKCANRLSAPMGVPAVHAALRRLKLSANWVLMVAFQDKVPVPVRGMEGVFIKGSQVLSWAANNTAKLLGSSNDAELESWTLISTQKYGKANKVPQEAIPPEVAARVTEEMLESFAQALGMKRSALPAVVYSKPQLWGAALPLNTPNVECLWDSVGRVGVAGDWVAGGGSMEAAALSGAALAKVISAQAKGEKVKSCGLDATFSRVQGEDIGVFPDGKTSSAKVKKERKPMPV